MAEMSQIQPKANNMALYVPVIFIHKNGWEIGGKQWQQEEEGDLLEEKLLKATAFDFSSSTAIRRYTVQQAAGHKNILKMVIKQNSCIFFLPYSSIISPKQGAVTTQGLCAGC